MRSFMKIKSLQNGEIIPLFTDIGKSYLSCEFQTSQICLLTPFAKIEFSQKFPGLQYLLSTSAKPCHILWFHTGDSIYLQYLILTLCILMDSSFWFDTINLGYSIVYI